MMSWDAPSLPRVPLIDCNDVQVGGTPAVLKYLMEKGFIDGSCLTVTGEFAPVCQ